MRGTFDGVASPLGSRPVLSLILCSRNDTYMGNSRWRLETSLNYVAAEAEARGLAGRIEMLVADWGSETPLRDVVRLTPAAAAMVAFLSIPPELARSLQGDSPFPEVIALNAAARRARGDYIGRIDQDTLVGRQFLSTFFDVVAGRMRLGISSDQALFFARRRRIPYRFAVRCPPLRLVRQFVSWFGRRLRVESGPRWAPFYVSSVGIWLVHRNLWHECGGYDEDMIHMGGMEGNMIARLMKKYRIVDLGSVVDHDFYHLEHYHPWMERHCYTFRKGNDDAFRMEPRLRDFNPNGPSWGLAGSELVRDGVVEHRRSESRFRESAWKSVPFILTVGAQIMFESIALMLVKAPGRLTARLRVWTHRARVARSTIAGHPLSAWPRVLRTRWTNRSASALVFPTNIHSVRDVLPQGSSPRGESTQP